MTLTSADFTTGSTIPSSTGRRAYTSWLHVATWRCCESICKARGQGRQLHGASNIEYLQFETDTIPRDPSSPSIPFYEPTRIVGSTIARGALRSRRYRRCHSATDLSHPQLGIPPLANGQVDIVTGSGRAQRVEFVLETTRPRYSACKLDYSDSIFVLSHFPAMVSRNQGTSTGSTFSRT